MNGQQTVLHKLLSGKLGTAVCELLLSSDFGIEMTSVAIGGGLRREAGRATIQHAVPLKQHADHAITMQSPCNHHAITMQSPCNHHATTMQSPCNHHAITMQTMQSPCRSCAIPSCCRGHSPAQSVSYTKQQQCCCKELIVFCTSLTAHHAGLEGEQGVPAYPKAVS